MFEPHRIELRREEPGTHGQGLQPGMPDFVFTPHLLDQQLGIRPDEDLAFAVVDRPLEGRQQTVVFRHVVRCDSKRAVQFREDLAGGVLEPDAIAGRTWIPAGAPVDVGGDHGGQDVWDAVLWAGA